ncbi:DUF4238 domain-containing protein [Ralstonia pseudosolanacearum]|uniref:DUF4238 domain-containing protein n=1 Tax=Ralstonia pseudosolanacearum TaxID=1310165 RepID=UPI002676CD06|nr:DUF4238 domain-containing protein [Ralstonia pseudosolanacearum]MDO3510597.1 DUF4238 domain-containing protein [Ralstonia pseudosolanacearum]MDO3629618.1 DUF4238 domain-containing protein [Ralstonia pseudosolanacearum]
MTTKKRHHYVPKAYLKPFTDAQGRVLVYRKDDPAKVLHVSPDGTGFERYYYSQPTPDGGVDHNRLEDLFSQTEGLWPAVVERLRRGEDVNDTLPLIFEFMLLQRVRVPASRDATEAKLAAQVHQTMLDLVASGMLPPPPSALVGRLDEVIVSIDPHKSIHGMVDDVFGSRSVFESIGLCAIQNRTDTPFLTSDNPVIWFDPTAPVSELQPYAISAGGPVMLLFPVSPTTILVGATERMAGFKEHGLMYGETTDEDWVFRVNVEVCRFAYKAVYANKPGLEGMVAAFADESPVWQRDGGAGRLVFGRREVKPKWEPK